MISSAGERCGGGRVPSGAEERGRWVAGARRTPALSTGDRRAARYISAFFFMWSYIRSEWNITANWNGTAAGSVPLSLFACPRRTFVMSHSYEWDITVVLVGMVALASSSITPSLRGFAHGPS